jgi:hypothetical protein
VGKCIITFSESLEAFFDNILYQKEELQQNFRFFKHGYKFFTVIPY